MEEMNWQTEYACMHHFVEKQVDEQPDAIALIQGDRTMTYQELNRKANQVAHRLVQRGLQNESTIGVFMERSIEFAILILAVLKTGQSYLPLTPSLPEERIGFIFQDANVQVVLSHSALYAQCTELRQTQPDLTWVLLDEEQAEIEQQATDNLEVDVTADHPAYVSYTSGSTGVPKGVVVPHRSMLGFLRDERLPFVHSKQVTLQHSSILWDVLVLELWGALASGGTCVLYEENVLVPAALQQAAERHGITVMWLTSSLFNYFVDSSDEVLQQIPFVMTGGEVLSPHHIERALQKYPNTTFLNGYGPSECVVFSSVYVIPREYKAELGPLPIGTAVGDREIYLLDEQLQEVERGERGELYVGGAGVSLGYLHRPELTASHYIPNPFAKDGSLLYRTGDQARYRPDGNLEYLGRQDQQVKIRGIRIELGEIESVLTQHPLVKQAVIDVQEHGGEKQLVAYYVPWEQAPTTEELRAYLGTQLPSNMVPAYFCALAQFPLNSNGKLERKALPQPDRTSQAYVAPRNEVERTLAAIWREVLKLEVEVGIETDFHELGGNSLLATQVLVRLNQAFDLQVPMRDVIFAATIVELAEVVDRQQKQQGETVPKQAAPAMVALKRESRRGRKGQDN